MTVPLMELRNATKRFGARSSVTSRMRRWLGDSSSTSVVTAVDRVTLAIDEGEVVGLVGESGCGKSTLGRMAVGLLPLSEGERLWRGSSVHEAQEIGINDRLASQMIFQDPQSSLNPRKRVLEIVGEAPRVHGLVTRADQGARVAELLERVGLDVSMTRAYPHQLSGGQRARVGIARALAVHPRFLVCDEALASLDVSIQAQVLNLFIQLRADLGLTYLFVSHDLVVVRHIADRISIMYLGRIVESAPTDELFTEPNHPYAQGLLAEAPSLVARKRDFIGVSGEIPSPLDPPAGCHFHPRCPYVMERCKTQEPELREIAPRRFSACHLNDRS
ncbi:MAG: ABC transporter ATP-binding protein [Burkholderiaceae bacterium]